MCCTMLKGRSQLQRVASVGGFSVHIWLDNCAACASAETRASVKGQGAVIKPRLRRACVRGWRCARSAGSPQAQCRWLSTSPR